MMAGQVAQRLDELATASGMPQLTHLLCTMYARRALNSQLYRSTCAAAHWQLLLKLVAVLQLFSPRIILLASAPRADDTATPTI
jgi:hypothetical protein